MSKIIKIDKTTDFATIMNEVKGETRLSKMGGNFKYFDVKIDGKWETFYEGDEIIITNENLIFRKK